MTFHITAMDEINLAAWVAFGFVFYFLPFVIAILRANGRETFVFLINAGLGWTVAGWFAAMYLALHDEPRLRRPRRAVQARSERRSRRRLLYSTSKASTFSS
ncbi:MAG TPA: superinfection immunity protein [Dehalococcoidia bacterium]|nr:superinfection immunity protein [Dehalococcoidia bacterium]